MNHNNNNTNDNHNNNNFLIWIQSSLVDETNISAYKSSADQEIKQDLGLKCSAREVFGFQ